MVKACNTQGVMMMQEIKLMPQMSQEIACKKGCGNVVLTVPRLQSLRQKTWTGMALPTSSLFLPKWKQTQPFVMFVVSHLVFSYPHPCLRPSLFASKTNPKKWRRTNFQLPLANLRFVELFGSAPIVLEFT